MLMTAAATHKSEQLFLVSKINTRYVGLSHTEICLMLCVCHPGVTVLPSSTPQCLMYVQLPYMEDLRQFTFPSLENNKKFAPSGETSWDPIDQRKLENLVGGGG